MSGGNKRGSRKNTEKPNKAEKQLVMEEISESIAGATRAATAAKANISEHGEGAARNTDGQGQADTLRAGLPTLSNDIRELKQELRQELIALKAELKQEVKEEISSLRQEIDRKLSEASSDL